MQARRLQRDEFWGSPVTKVVALLALASQCACYRTWTEAITPPPLADSVTLTLERGHTVMVLHPRPEGGSTIDSITTHLGAEKAVTLLRPELEGRRAVWGWTRDGSLAARTLVTSTGVQTVSGPDSVRVRIPLVVTHRDLQDGETTLLVAGIALAAAAGFYAVLLIALATG